MPQTATRTRPEHILYRTLVTRSSKQVLISKLAGQISAPQSAYCLGLTLVHILHACLCSQQHLRTYATTCHYLDKHTYVYIHMTAGCLAWAQKSLCILVACMSLLPAGTGCPQAGLECLICHFGLHLCSSCNDCSCAGRGIVLISLPDFVQHFTWRFFKNRSGKAAGQQRDTMSSQQSFGLLKTSKYSVFCNAWHAPAQTRLGLAPSCTLFSVF